MDDSKDQFGELDQILECPLCLERCTEPKGLPCMHVYCTDCITKLIHKSATVGMFLCPFCRTDIQIPKGGAKEFPTAFLHKTVADAVDKLKQSNLKQEHRRCSVCSAGKLSKMFCNDCVESMCETCLQIHNKHHQEHSMVSCSEQHLTCKDTEPPTPALTVDKEQLREYQNIFNNKLEDYNNSVRQLVATKAGYQEQADATHELLKEHGDRVVKRTAELIIEAQERVRTGSQNIYTMINSLIETLALKKSKLIQAKQEIDNALSSDQTHISQTELKTYDDMLKSLYEDCSSVPELQVSVKLVSPQQLTANSLLGSVSCEFKHSHSQDTASGYDTDECSKFKNPFAMPVSVQNFTSRLLNKHTLWYIPSGIVPIGEGNVAVSQYLCNVVKTVTSPNSCHSKTLDKIKASSTFQALGIATKDDQLYVMDNSSKAIMVLDNTGNNTATIPVNFKGRGGIAIYEDRLYVTSESDNEIYMYFLCNGTGNWNKTLFAEKKDGVKKPYCIAASDTTVAVSSYNNHEVYVFDVTGKLRYTYGGRGSGPGQLYWPCGVALDSGDRLLVSDYNNHCIRFLSHDGQHIADINLMKNQISYPTSLSVKNTDNNHGEVYVGYGASFATYEYSFA